MIKRKGANFRLCIGSFLLGFSVQNVIRVYISLALTKDSLSIAIHVLWVFMSVTGLSLILSGFLAHKRLDKLQEKDSIKRKEAEAIGRRIEAELLAKPITGLDTSSKECDPLLEQYIHRHQCILNRMEGQQAPTYVPPTDVNNDPYAARPHGFSNQQAAQGFPQQPVQIPPSPFDDLE